MADLTGLEALDELLTSRGAPAVSPGRQVTKGTEPKMARSKVLASLPQAVPCQVVLLQRDAILKGLANDESRHQSVSGPVLHLVRLGASGHAGVADVLENLGTAFSESVKEDRGDGASEARAEFTRLVEGALKIVLKSKLADPYGLCRCRSRELRRLLRDRSLFTTKGGRATELKVMRYLLSRADQHESRLIQEAQRQIAEATDAHQPTVSKALRRLEHSGWVTPVRTGPRTSPGSYLITEPSALMDVSTALPAERAGSSVDNSTSGLVHRLFGPQGLRGGAYETFAELPEWRVSVGRRVLVRLAPGSVKSSAATTHVAGRREMPTPQRRTGMTVRDLHDALGTPQPTVRAQLGRLQRHRMVFKDSGGRWWRYRFDPEWLADSLDIADTAERKSKKHLLERHLYWEGRAYLDEGDRRAVSRVETPDSVTYVSRTTGEILWTNHHQPA